jgi:STE24 endopeptidase
MFVFWLAWKPQYSRPALFGAYPSIAIFLGFYALLVLGTGLWSRRLRRKVAGPMFSKSLDRFNVVMLTARVLIPLWFMVGIAVLGWWQTVERIISNPRGIDLTQTTIGVLLGTLPAFGAWVALWWSQYPAEVAFREQSMLSHLEFDMPVFKPPGFASYFKSNVRLQLLFMIVPVCLIVALHDLFRLAATLALGSRWGINDAENPFSWLAAAAVIFLFAPEILRRVLHTEPLANSPLRRRLESLCRRTGVKYRDILLWRTQNNVGNAAVMGFVPRFRYILLSDLLLETMTDEQIEAVFAHELGHIVHRHMAWLVVFIMVLMLFNLGGGAWVTRWMAHAGVSSEAAQGIVIGTTYLFKFLLLFGFVSRRFERQADVFAARTMELSRATVPDIAASDMLLAARKITGSATAALALAEPLEYASDYAPGHVGQYGAAVFGSALHRVAMVNNIPVKARSWCHGSIANRMQYLHDLSADPTRTKRFDRLMLFLYAAMVFALFAGVAFCWASNALT